MDMLQFRPATTGDLSTLIPVIREFHAEERIAWNEPRLRAAMEDLVAHPLHGRLVLIERHGALAGYFAVGFCFSLEFGGR
ncbi:MAG TPA: hypothetical protein VGD42_13770 [Lysobacter sp.]